MALTKDNVGKQCVVNFPEDPSVDNYKLGTIVEYYSDSQDTYYTISIGSSGECLRFDDDTNITLL